MPARHPVALDSPLVALELVTAALDDAPNVGFVVLVEDPGGGGVALAIETDGAPDPRAVAEQVVRLLDGLPAEPARRVVLASVRTEDGLAAEAELAAWRGLRRAVGPAVELLDWFVVDDDRAVSLAELTAPPTEWHRRAFR